MVKRRDEKSGRYTATVSDDEIVDFVLEQGGVATVDVADEFDYERPSAYRRLKSLEDADRVTSRAIGNSLLWEAVNAGERSGERDGQERRETPPEPVADTDPIDPGRRDHAEDMDALENVDFPAGRDRDDCLTAVHAARDYLREHGPASMSEFVVDVMPEHPAGYDAEQDVARINDPDARNRSTWWRKVVRPGLEALSDVKKPAGGGEWRPEDRSGYTDRPDEVPGSG